MYPVSAAYKEAIKRDVRHVKIMGTITLKDNTIINITDEDIVQGSLYITEQCVSGEDIEVGNVYASEMGLSLSTPLEDPYSLDGARILLYFGIDVGGLWEMVPLGYFYVTEIQRKANNVNLTALDGMLLFDIPVGEPGSSSPRNFVVHACEQAGVPLGTSVFEIDTFANAGVLLAAPDVTKIKTARDLLMWACQIMGAFARMNRQGELEIVPIKARASVKTISKAERFNSDVSDFAVKITRVSMQVGEAEYSRGTDGMTMVLEENPLMTGLSESQINTVLDNLLAQITTAVYVPFNSNFIGDPALQPGDFVTLSDTSVLGGGDVASIITHSTWRYRGPHNIKGAGKHGLVRGVQNQQMKAVSSIVAIARAAQDLALAANQSTQLIKDAIGGHVLIRQNPDETNEILIMDNPDPDQAVKIWRWNMGGLGYSDNCVGADNPDREYEIAMTMDGAINANFIKTGQLDAGVVRIGPETTFAPGYDPSQIEGASAVGMGVDADCLGLWHFDGSLNSHKGVAATFTRSSVAYLSDGTQVASGQPRFEPGKFGQGVLVEEETINLIVDPHNLGTSNWTKESFTGTVTPNAITAPDGTLTATKVDASTGYLFQKKTIIGGVRTITLSCYLRSLSGTYTTTLGIWCYDGSAGSGLRASKLVTLTEQWQRFSLTYTAAADETSFTFSPGTSPFIGGGGKVYVWGVQVEQKPYATSFTPGTRSSETLTIPTAGVLNPTEGTISLWVKPPKVISSEGNCLWATSGTQRFDLWWSGNDRIGIVIGSISIHSNRLISSLQDGNFHAIAVTWGSFGNKLYIDGVLDTSSAALVPSNLGSDFYVGGFSWAGYESNSIIDELRIDKIARTDEEIQAWYKANAPFYTSEDMKQWPGYMKLETDGLKVYDSSDALRVLVGSWLKDAVRKYGIKIIDGEIYSSLISTAGEGAQNFIRLNPPHNLEVYGAFGDNPATLQLIISAAGGGGSMWFYNDGLLVGQMGAGAEDKLYLFSIKNKLVVSGYGGVEVIGGLDVSGGTKNCVDPTENYGFRAMSAVEAPEILFYDRGQVDLVNGEATVYFDPIYLEMIEPDTELTPWQIWVECYGENGVYVSEVGADYFKVKERNGGTSNNKVIWRFEAIRKGYAGIRLMEVTN